MAIGSKNTCASCFGNGRCSQCDGSGLDPARSGEQRKCPRCSGTGSCPACHGTGAWMQPPPEIIDHGTLEHRSDWKQPDVTEQVIR